MHVHISVSKGVQVCVSGNAGAFGHCACVLQYAHGGVQAAAEQEAAAKAEAERQAKRAQIEQRSQEREAELAKRREQFGDIEHVRPWVQSCRDLDLAWAGVHKDTCLRD